MVMTHPTGNSGFFFAYDLSGQEVYHSRFVETNLQALQNVSKEMGLFEDKKVVFLKLRFVDKSREIDTLLKDGYYEVSRENIIFLKEA